MFHASIGQVLERSVPAAATVVFREDEVVIDVDGPGAGACRSGSLIAIGWIGREIDHGTSLEQRLLRLLARYQQCGIDALETIEQDFAVAIWDRTSRLLVFGRDFVGATPLYYAEGAAGIEISDDCDRFDRRRIDPEFVADFIVHGGIVPTRTIWTGVERTVAGAVYRWTGGSPAIARQWRPPAEEAAVTEAEAGGEYRRLIEDGLTRHLEPNGSTWAHLSGGLDSSTVVCVAEQLWRQGRGPRLAGTITFQDPLASDETRYINAVREAYPGRTEVVEGFWPWKADETPPPRTPEPARDFPFYARDRRVASILRAAGSSTLLSGIGPDYCFPITPWWVAEAAARGRWRQAGSAIIDWAIARRIKMWTAAGELLSPLLPTLIRSVIARRGATAPVWLRRDWAKAHDVQGRMVTASFPAGPRRELIRNLTLGALRRAGASLGTWGRSGGVHVTHPLLTPAIVRFALTLPTPLKVNLKRPKPVLRAAVCDVLPPLVLNRRLKGFSEPSVRWALGRERAALRRLLEQSTLAAIGAIEPAHLWAAIDACAAGREGEVAQLYAALSLETWLATRRSELR